MPYKVRTLSRKSLTFSFNRPFKNGGGGASWYSWELQVFHNSQPALLGLGKIYYLLRGLQHTLILTHPLLHNNPQNTTTWKLFFFCITWHTRGTSPQRNFHQWEAYCVIGHLCGTALPSRENKLLSIRENHWQPSMLGNCCVYVHTERFPISRGLLSCEERWLCFKRHREGKTEFNISNNN